MRLLPHQERPNRGSDDGEQKRHLPKLAKAENVNDIKKDEVFADYDPAGSVRGVCRMPPVFVGAGGTMAQGQA